MKHCKKIIWLLSFFLAVRADAQNIDLAILKSINPRYPNALVWRVASGSVDWISGGISLGTLAYGYIAKDKAITHNGYELLMTIGINMGVTQALKITVNRTRPSTRYPNEVFVRSVSRDKSFPSGHTSDVFAIATTLTLQYHKWYVTVPAYAWAGCVGYSRLYLGKHYPSDVLAGALTGVASSYVSHLITKKRFRQKKAGQEK
ncbi:MAG: phosphatase PAP2 family protein [Bacteroidota bacterium]